MPEQGKRTQTDQGHGGEPADRRPDRALSPATAGLIEQIRSLEQKTAALGAAIAFYASETARALAPWSAAVHDLAVRVLPLSLKDVGNAPFERHLAALDRQRVRLERESAQLRERSTVARERIAELRGARRNG